jgi:Golgi nucleoside diphosphatase
MLRLIVVLISCCIFTNVSAERAVCQQQQCIAVVDAGSTGSRLHIYSFDLDSNHNPIQIKEYWSKKIKPGFATLAPNQQVIDDYLNQLFQGSPTQTMPVYFYATGGMRLLPKSKQQPYYQHLQRWFSQQKKWQLIEAKTITGGEEGVLGWLAVNYKLGAFTSNGIRTNYFPCAR